MHAVDTNVIVRLIVRDEARQLAAAENLLRKGIWISSVVVTETVWVLGSVYGFGRDDISGAIRMMLDLENGELEDRAVVSAALVRFSNTPRVGFEDCLVLETARSKGHMPLATFDRALARMTGVERIA
jgi:predicted nucleic-acid-binding protein